MISPTLVGGFFVVAIAYAMVGFGGGSTYNALLVLADIDYRLIPTIALTCNILVVTGGVWHFWRAGHLQVGQVLPFLALSVPMAWIGGKLPVSELLFTGLLGASLMITALQMLLRSPQQDTARRNAVVNPWLIGLPFGAAIGLLSGIVGIGGGIFLAPLLHLMHWGRAQQIAATASAFILLNSLAGLAGQLMKQGGGINTDQYFGAWPLFIAVVIGGQIGSRLGSRHLPERWVKVLTGLLILYVSIRLLVKWAVLSQIW